MTSGNGASPPVSWLWVDSEDLVEASREALAAAEVLAVDTEYDSLRYFREKLCLVQVCDGKTVYLFDPLSGLDLRFLGKLFRDPAILKILHAGDNDIRLFHRDFGFVFRNIFDTHRAASVLGCPFLSLAHLLEVYLGLTVPKSKRMQRSKWETRPLAEDQLLYAARDVFLLFDLHERLKNELEDQGLLEQAGETFQSLESIRWREKSYNPGGFQRLEGFDDLDDREKARLKRLFLWRFEKARETNMARFIILSDEALMALCRHFPADIHALGRTGILSSRQLKRFGKDIVALLSAVPPAPALESDHERSSSSLPESREA